MAPARAFGSIRKLPSGRYQARYWLRPDVRPAEVARRASHGHRARGDHRHAHRAHRQYVGPEPDAVLFTSVKGSLLLNRYFAPYWLAAKRSAGVDESVRFHDLRHLAGTAAATAGGSLREIMARMGHQSSDAALRYLKAAEARDSEIADAIGARLAKA